MSVLALPGHPWATTIWERLGQPPSSPGYRTIAYRPRPGGGITWANTRHETPYGAAALSWKLTEHGITADVTVPEGCRGVVGLPGRGPVELGPGTARMTSTT